MPNIARYLPLSDTEKQQLLNEFGLNTSDDLFRTIPAAIRHDTSALPAAMCEIEVDAAMRFAPAAIRRSFTGGYAHHHYIPTVIDHLVGRGEFLTAYTPYQPEVSQGTLQAMYEYQSMMAELMGVDVSNASLYDGSTALTEAALMASRITRKKRILVSSLIHKEYLETLQTTLNIDILIPHYLPAAEDGRLDSQALKRELESAPGEFAALLLQSPNSNGIVEPLTELATTIHEAKALLVTSTTEALSLALLRPPGGDGADIVTGEAQSFGIPVGGGGPYLGFIGCNQKHMRNLPGRLVGEGRDAEGRRAFLITLAAREQHIRRDKATSNICTNQGLMALRAAIYLSLMGKAGVVRAAERSHRFASYGRKLAADIPGIQLPFPNAAIFNEFLLQSDRPAAELFQRSVELAGVAPGTVVGERQLLVAFDETMSKGDVELWAETLKKAGGAK